MKKIWPRSLFARLMLIWLLGSFLILIVSIAIFVMEQMRIDREARENQFTESLQEIVSNAKILDLFTPQARQDWLEDRNRLLEMEKSDRRQLRLSLRKFNGEHSQPFPDDHPFLQALRNAMPERDPRLYAIRRRENDPRTLEHLPLRATITLTDGVILTAYLPSGNPPPRALSTLRVSVLSGFLALALGVGILTWFCVRIATRPISRLADAARALGEDPERAPLELIGPTEVIQAAEAFNQMQQRISAHVHERTRILASISHDLQTPITRLRLRIEMCDDETLKTRIQADLDAMQSLIREGLDYARSMEVTAPEQPIDLTSLLAALCSDATDMGWAVTLTGQTSTPFMGQPLALRRALWNLIENGVKFGTIVDIKITEVPEAYRIVIRDHGAGLPVEERERVFEPFYRTESSRNRATGGTGLGLAITRNLLHVQRGQVTLDNHPEGGLVATVILPR
jgi:protein-histidine pros-kinase